MNELRQADSFERMAKLDWSRAVAIASLNISDYRSQLLSALASADPSVRSAAVASLNEAEDSSSHNEVFSLLKDPDPKVRYEVAEYLMEYALPSDSMAILNAMEHDPDLLFLLSSALRHITGRIDGLIDEEDPPSEIKAEMEAWRQHLQRLGLGHI